MKLKTYQDREKWLEDRLGKITGSRLKDIVVKRGTGKKKGFWELIAERIATARDGERPMDRGNRLEPEAIEKFIEVTGKKDVNTDLVMWMRDDDENIAVSPDGFIGDVEAIEIKCLNSASHVEALWTKRVPDEYEFQVLQYFIVNEQLENLYFCFYDPTLIKPNDFFFLTITRDSLKEDIETYLKYQQDTLAEVEEIVAKLSF